MTSIGFYSANYEANNGASSYLDKQQQMVYVTHVYTFKNEYHAVQFFVGVFCRYFVDAQFVGEVVQFIENYTYK